MKLQDKPVFITADEAIAALPEHEKIHSFLGMFGADWSRDKVVEAIKSAKRVAWAPHMIGHELAIERIDKDGKQDVVRFDVKAPTVAG